MAKLLYPETARPVYEILFYFILFYVFVSIRTSKIIIIQVTQTALRIQENYYNSEKSPTFFPFKVLKCLYNLIVVITGVSSRLFWIETVF